MLLRCLLGWQGIAGLSASPSGKCIFTSGVVGHDGAPSFAAASYKLQALLFTSD